MFADNPDLEKIEKEYAGRYDEGKVLGTLKKYGKKLGLVVAEQAVTLYYAMLSSNVDVKYKGMILGGLAYLGVPLDAIPDFIPVAGYTDDAAVIAAVFGAVQAVMDKESSDKAADKMHDWFPEEYADKEKAHV